jgi:hypothetical protein
MHLPNNWVVDGEKKCFGRYCIPTTDDRPITAAEKKFFNECGTGIGTHHLMNILIPKMSLSKYQ